VAALAVRRRRGWLNQNQGRERDLRGRKEREREQERGEGERKEKEKIGGNPLLTAQWSYSQAGCGPRRRRPPANQRGKRVRGSLVVRLKMMMV